MDNRGRHKIGRSGNTRWKGAIKPSAQHPAMISMLLNQNEYLSTALLAFNSLTVFTINSFISPLPSTDHCQHVESCVLFSVCVVSYGGSEEVSDDR